MTATRYLTSSLLLIEKVKDDTLEMPVATVVKNLLVTVSILATKPFLTREVIARDNNVEDDGPAGSSQVQVSFKFSLPF